VTAFAPKADLSVQRLKTVSHVPWHRTRYHGEKPARMSGKDSNQFREGRPWSCGRFQTGEPCGRSTYASQARRYARRARRKRPTTAAPTGERGGAGTETGVTETSSRKNSPRVCVLVAKLIMVLGATADTKIAEERDDLAERIAAMTREERLARAEELIASGKRYLPVLEWVEAELDAAHDDEQVQAPRTDG
jgi:hypothetical protein